MSNVCRVLLILTVSLWSSDFLVAENQAQVPVRKKSFRAYIIEKDGKKVEGKLISGTLTANEVKITFIHPNGDKKKYRPVDILGYGFEEEMEDNFGMLIYQWRHYEVAQVDISPAPFAPKTVFIEKIIKGEIDLYIYYVEVRNNPSQPFKYFYYVKEEAGNFKKIRRENFKAHSRNLFKDYQAMLRRIGTKDFQYRNLERMAKDYNYWVTNQHHPSEYRVSID